MSESDETTPQEKEQEAPEAEAAPILNREQRRALARGGKTSTTGSKNASLNHAAKAQTHGATGGVRYPRTGHK